MSENIWTIDTGDASVDVWGEIHDRLIEMDEAGELYSYIPRDVLAEFIQEHYCWRSGNYDQGDLDAGIMEADDRYIGDSLEDYAREYLESWGDASGIIERYQGVIIEAMVRDLQLAGDLEEIRGEWFRTS